MKAYILHEGNSFFTFCTKTIMKYRVYILMWFCILFSAFFWTQAWFFDDFLNDGAPEIRYCQWDYECGLDQGIEKVKEGITDIETERTASEYVQDLVVYILTFLSIVAVLYIIYAGFQILLGGWDEEKVKKSKQTILYVAIGVIVIWLAWPITSFILLLLNA